MAIKVSNPNTAMGASGATHAAGVVPDPGVTSGSAHFLREDATWATAVQSVGLTVPAEFTVSGSPVTGSGSFSISKASQASNTVWAAPASGSGVPSFRILVQKDIPGVLVPTKSAVTSTAGVLNLDASIAASFRITLHENVTTLSISNGVDGQEILLLWVQNATGTFTVATPASISGLTAPSAAANSVTTQKLTFDSTNSKWYAIGASNL